MKFTFEERIIDTEKFNLDMFDWWYERLGKELNSINEQLRVDLEFMSSGSPCRSTRWRNSAREQSKYLKSVKGQLEHCRNEFKHKNMIKVDNIKDSFIKVVKSLVTEETFKDWMDQAKRRLDV